MEKKQLKLKNLIPLVIGVVGIVIVLIAGGNSTESEQATAEGMQDDITAYTAGLEEKIKKLCEACEGVSHVSVAITLEGGFEYEYAKNTEYGKNSYGDERKEEYLVIGQGSGEKCVVLRQKLPGIAGVGVVCRGGDDDVVREQLTMLISSVLNIGANKIYITSADK